MMDDNARDAYEKQAQELRIELKTWEVDWAGAHNGKKPAHNDIKGNPKIAQKYKQYNKIRDLLSGKIPPPSRGDVELESRKRKPHEALPSSYTPKRVRTAETPRTGRFSPRGTPNGAITPSLSRRLFGPKLPTSVSPTPQRDGRVLGLFDLLARTPSRTAGEGLAAAAAVTARIAPHSQTTPRKHEAGIPGLMDSLSNPAGQQHPNAHAADQATTPLHKRDGNTGGAKTPSSSSARRLSSSVARLRSAKATTPAFLRRAPLPMLDENEEWQVAPLRLPRKPLGRSLSGMVAGLRRLEEEAAEEDLDILREMEMEEASKGAAGALPGMSKSLPKPSAQGSLGAPSRTEEKMAGSKPKGGGDDGEDLAGELPDSRARQRPVLLGGFDDEALYDSPEEGEDKQDGQPRRVFKKKGQKRTTRLVNMRPTRTKRPVQPNVEQAADDGEEGAEIVPETQLNDNARAGVTGDDGEEPDLASGSEFEDSDASDGDAKGAAPKKGSKQKKKEPPKQTEAGKDGLVKKAVRTIKATAHQNFKRLKLRNRGAKGGPGYNSRFRRKR